VHASEFTDERTQARPITGLMLAWHLGFERLATAATGALMQDEMVDVHLDGRPFDHLMGVVRLKRYREFICASKGILKMEQNFNSFIALHQEKYLNDFLEELSLHLKQKIRLETLITLYFNRSGSLSETSSEIIYFLDTEGLSASDRQTLADIVQAVTAMNIKSKEGKPIRARLKGRK